MRKKYLFVALSDSQENYYHALIAEGLILGEVVRIKFFKHGSFLKAYRWAKKNNICSRSWVEFKFQTLLVNNRAYGFNKILKFFLQLDALRFADAFKNKLENFKPDGVVIFNGAHYKHQAAISVAKQAQKKIIFLELGCFPNTTMVDDEGVNAASSVSRNAEFYRGYQPKNDTQLPNALITREDHPGRVSQDESNDLPLRYIFVPFQVHDDTQVLINSPWVPTMQKFYEALETSLPYLDSDISFVIKEHPSDKVTYPDLYSKNERILFANGNNTQALIENSCAVITLNSTVGIESLLLGKSVITLGNAFYNIEGVATHAFNQTSLNNTVQNLANLERDADLIKSFLFYLQENYLIEGWSKNFDQKHLLKMSNRMISLIE